MNPVRIIIHNTADASQAPQLQKVNEYHRSEGFPLSSLGFYVGYTYFIERDGKTIQTRTDTEMQAHTKGWNTDSVGIALAMNGDLEQPSDAQLQSLKSLVLKKMTEWTIPPNNVFPHRNFTNAKTCPGRNISDAQIRSFFQPDLNYFQVMLNSMKDALLKLRRLGAKSDCVESEHH